MIYITLNEDESIKNWNYVPFDTRHGVSVEKMEKGGYLLDIQEADIPKPNVIEGKVATAYFNPATKEFYYKYSDYVPTSEEVLQARVEELEGLTGSLLMDIAMLKMGGM